MSKNDMLTSKLLNFTNAVNKSIDDQNWYSALTVSLMLPDVCGRLSYPDLSSSKRYLKWFDNYLKTTYSVNIMGEETIFLSGKDAYALRCAYLHGGETNIEGQRIQEVLQEFIFMAPQIKNGEYIGSHCIQVNDKLVLRVDLFCKDICEAVKVWISNLHQDEQIQKSANTMMEIHFNNVSLDNFYIE